MNQLEEVIDQKNEKIELLRGQLDSITASQEGGDIGSLRRQLLKMEQSMQVRKTIMIAYTQGGLLKSMCSLQNHNRCLCMTDLL